jgi:hypothetical protein
MKVGLSLSFCVKDIIEGNVDESEVDSIIANTAMRTEHDFMQVMDSYCRWYWYLHRIEAIGVCCRLWLAGKIIQPRLTNPMFCNDLTDGWWVEKVEE